MPYGSKRKRDDFDNSDEEPSLGKQILPVANLPEDFNDEPMDGMQYLFTVRRDARYLPHTTRVPNPFEIPEVPAAAPTSPFASHSALPCERWRTAFEKGFRNFRKNTVQPTIHIHIPQKSDHKLMPDKKERDCWWAFISGRPESEWNPPKRPKSEASLRRDRRYGRQYTPEPDSVEDQPGQETCHINDEGEVELALQDDPTESLPIPSGTPVPPDPADTNIASSSVPPNSQNQNEPQAITPREPTPSLAAHLDHRTSLHLLMYFTHWINMHLGQPELSSAQMTETHARWIFVLLSRVEDFISADDMSLLRSLARASLALLKQSMQRSSSIGAVIPTEAVPVNATQRDGDVISERSCWMIITAVAGVWGQRDLWIDAEAMLISAAT